MPRRYKTSSRIIGRYDGGTFTQQTLALSLPRMQPMDQHQSRQEENKEMIDMDIKNFLETARYYLLGLIPTKQPALATIPLRQARH